MSRSSTRAHGPRLREADRQEPSSRGTSRFPRSRLARAVRRASRLGPWTTPTGLNPRETHRNNANCGRAVPRRITESQNQLDCRVFADLGGLRRVASHTRCLNEAGITWQRSPRVPDVAGPGRCEPPLIAFGRISTNGALSGRGGGAAVPKDEPSHLAGRQALYSATAPLACVRDVTAFNISCAGLPAEVESSRAGYPSANPALAYAPSSGAAESASLLLPSHCSGIKASPPRQRSTTDSANHGSSKSAWSSAITCSAPPIWATTSWVSL